MSWVLPTSKSRPLSQGDGGGLLRVLADLLHLVEGGAGGHKAEAPLPGLLQALPPQGQAEAVHADHGETVLLNFEEGAGVDGPGLVGGDGKGGLGDHGAENPLLNPHGVLVLHLRQLRVVLGGEGGDVVGRVAAGEPDVQILVGGEDHHIVRQAADDLPEEPGGEDQRALLRDIGLQVGADAGVHIVAGDREAAARLEQDALQGGDGALGGYRPGGRGHGGLQKDFFTGEFHIWRSFLFFKKPEYFFSEKHKLFIFQ